MSGSEEVMFVLVPEVSFRSFGRLVPSVLAVGVVPSNYRSLERDSPGFKEELANF